MDSPRFERLKMAFQDLLDADPEQRAIAQERIAREDAELGAELAAWLAADQLGAAEWLERPAVLGLEDESEVRSEGWSDPGATASLVSGKCLGPYRIERELGRGGMGVVFLAVRDDGEFERRVAIKVVRVDRATVLGPERLRAECRILARLDDPRIARLYDSGSLPDGSPYFVMEHVAGEPLDRWCVTHGATVEERLRLLIEICGAVEAAHRRLVVHRDLKPGNILVCQGAGVGAAAQPKLLDFGIAKLLHDETLAGEPRAALTTAARALTPDYACPELLRGEPVTTAFDVYALGVILYQLLSGHLPHRRRGSGSDVGAELAVVAARLTGDAPEPPSRVAAPELRRRLSGDLDTIVLKAMHPEPARRYGSASQLADDLRRHLEGRPVGARRDRASYRAWKFARRHWLALAATAMVALALASSLVATLWQARIAEAQRARAERRFADVRRLANVVLFDVHAALENVSGAMAARRLLVDNALLYLDDLAREAGDEPALLAELAVAYERIGEVQGMPGWPSEGRTGDAWASFERALELRRRGRAAAGPAASWDEAAEARLLMRIGSVLAARGDTAAALEHHREALALLTPRLARAPSTAARLELAQAEVAVGDDLWELGDVSAAADRYTVALRIARAAVAANPTSTLAIRQAGVVEQRLGDAAAVVADWPRALAHHAASLAVDRQLAALRPDDVEIRRDLGTDLSRMGADHTAQGSLVEALARHREASRLREALLAEEPQDARAAEDAAESGLQVGKALAALGRNAEAMREMGVAIGRWQDLSTRDPKNVRWQDALASALAGRADVEARRGEVAAAAATLAQALAIRRRLVAESPDFAVNRQALAELERQMASRSQPPPGPEPR